MVSSSIRLGFVLSLPVCLALVACGSAPDRSSDFDKDIPQDTTTTVRGSQNEAPIGPSQAVSVTSDSSSVQEQQEGQASATCLACQADKCAMERARCDSDAACSAITECMRGAQSQDAYWKCIQAHSAGKTLAEQWFGCVDTMCQDPCNAPSTCHMSESCDSCLSKHCSESRAACDSSAACRTYQYCTKPCMDAECWLACDADYPEGKKLHDQAFSCWEFKCGECSSIALES